MITPKKATDEDRLIWKLSAHIDATYFEVDDVLDFISDNYITVPKHLHNGFSAPPYVHTRFDVTINRVTVVYEEGMRYSSVPINLDLTNFQYHESYDWCCKFLPFGEGGIWGDEHS